MGGVVMVATRERLPSPGACPRGGSPVTSALMSSAFRRFTMKNGMVKLPGIVYGPGYVLICSDVGRGAVDSFGWEVWLCSAKASHLERSESDRSCDCADPRLPARLVSRVAEHHRDRPGRLGRERVVVRVGGARRERSHVDEKDAPCCRGGVCCVRRRDEHAGRGCLSRGNGDKGQLREPLIGPVTFVRRLFQHARQSMKFCGSGARSPPQSEPELRGMIFAVCSSFPSPSSIDFVDRCGAGTGPQD